MERDLRRVNASSPLSRSLTNDEDPRMEGLHRAAEACDLKRRANTKLPMMRAVKKDKETHQVVGRMEVKVRVIMCRR